ncbi:MAG: hypothetical protein HOP07_07535 [Bacteriovoracaceae bacterium]|nr:hypothetical protein [Bacteriovoracaceae bacterium]NOT78841.1 hypothetical protein [Bacteriovoracaceae bacterium]
MILCHERFEEERQNVREAGISRSDFSQIDDTGARLNGKNGYSIAVCNQFLLIIIQVFQKIERLY